MRLGVPIPLCRRSWMRTDIAIAASEVRIPCHLWCSNASLLHLPISSSVIFGINCVYVIALGFGPAQLRVSFALVKGLRHDSRLFAFS